MAAVRLAGAVLTGGASTRMGSDKAFVRVDGIPMAVRVSHILADVGCAPVAFVGGDADSLALLGGMFVADSTPGQGPAVGIVEALRVLGRDADAVVIAACDLAHITRAQLVPLIDVLRRDGDGDGDGLIDVAVARTAERVQPLCAVWRSSAGATVRASFDAGVRSVFGLLDALRVEEVEVPADGLRNINSPADLGAGPAQH